MKSENGNKYIRTKEGIVSSDKMDKTVVVGVKTLKKHPKYKKNFKVTKKFYVHDEDNRFKKGDFVTIRETRPLSKTKRWEVVLKD